MHPHSFNLWNNWREAPIEIECNAFTLSNRSKNLACKINEETNSEQSNSAGNNSSYRAANHR